MDYEMPLRNGDERLTVTSTAGTYPEVLAALEAQKPEGWTVLSIRRTDG
jgi:20S proteasome alpha/beta subunit